MCTVKMHVLTILTGKGWKYMNNPIIDGFIAQYFWGEAFNMLGKHMQILQDDSHWNVFINLLSIVIQNYMYTEAV